MKQPVDAAPKLSARDSASVRQATTDRANPDRHIHLPGTRNLRDIGGYPAANGRRTRWRTLLRTDALDRIPPTSQERLLEMGLRQVIDLRWPHELEEAPSVFVESRHLAYTSIPLLDDDPTPHVGLAGTYRHIFDKRGEQLIAVVRAILAPKGTPAVIGCAAGKDRTGVTIALILAALGVPRETIVADYTLSAEIFAASVVDEYLIDWRAEAADVECPPEHMQGALEHLDRRHGGAEGLLRAHGLAPAEIERMTELLTEPAAWPRDVTGST